MDSSFNIDNLIRKPSEPDIINMEIFRVAALLYEYDLKKDFQRFGESDKGLLKSFSFLGKEGMHGLSDELRNRILSEIGANRIIDQIKSNNIKSGFSTALIRLLNNNRIDCNELSDIDLFYLLKIAGFLPDKVDAESIKSELQQRYFFMPFKKITRNFAGREKELAILSEYVDWLPKKGIINQTIGFFRNAVNWHEKPPLLIQGIGGIGKSTLVSKFIIEQNNKKKGNQLPFVYIDFDLPGFTITEPVTILIECLRQLSLQFPKQKDIFDEIIKIVSDLMHSSDLIAEDTVYQSTTKTSRGFIYKNIQDLMKKFGWRLSKLNFPVLIVFDSFEEIQYRASRDELASFFSFIKEISEKARIRPVFVGRSEISERLGDFKFDKIELKEFDFESAVVLLNKYGIEDADICRNIYENFGGNPLLLLLASELVKKDKNAVMDFRQVRDKKHEFLINRIVDQIHDPDVRKITVPGMLVRKINPEVIREILAEPCNLEEINEIRSNEIFDSLGREVAVISKSLDGNDIMFRQDLRMACEKMITGKYPEESKMIRKKAIEYYLSRRNENTASEAEYFYHILKTGEIPEDFTRETFNRIRVNLESSLIELPPEVQLHINTMLGSKASSGVIFSSSATEWEKYYLSLIRKGLNSELAYLNNLYKEIAGRSERSGDPGSAFPVYEALLCQRLNKLDRSNSIIEKAFEITASSNKEIIAELSLIEIRNLEYSGNYGSAFTKCVSAFSKLPTLPPVFAGKILFLFNRLLFRQNQIRKEIKLQYPEGMFKDVTWDYILKNNPLLHNFPDSSFKSGDEFDYIYESSLDNIKDLQELEEICRKRCNLFLKDITMTGELEIVLKDFLYILELKGLLEILDHDR